MGTSSSRPTYYINRNLDFDYKLIIIYIYKLIKYNFIRVDCIFINKPLQPIKFEIKKKLISRSERVKSVELHPEMPWVVAGLYSGNITIYDYNT